MLEIASRARYTLTVSRALRSGLLLAAAVALSLGGCRWKDPFPEYQGVNLITQRGLSVDSFSHAYMDGSDPATMFEYVRVTTVTAAQYVSTEGLPAGLEGTIRRLEAVNLFPDGDFEASAVGSPPVNWDVDSATLPPASDPAIFEVADPGPITGKALQFSTAGASAGVLHLDTFMLDGFTEPAIYFLNLQFVRENPIMTMTFDYGDDATTSYLVLDNQPWVIEPRDDGLTPVETLPTRGDRHTDIVADFKASGTGVNYFYVGSPQGAAGQAGHVDNIRVGRLDTIPHVAVEIPLAGDGDSLPLVPGTYELSVYVKAEINDQVTPSANGRNRFRAGQIALGINANNFELFTREEVGWTTDTWQRVSARFQVDPAHLENDPPLVGRITVIHRASPAIGSVLIAEPRLELFSTE